VKKGNSAEHNVETLQKHGINYKKNVTKPDKKDLYRLEKFRENWLEKQG